MQLLITTVETQCVTTYGLRRSADDWATRQTFERLLKQDWDTRMKLQITREAGVASLVISTTVAAAVNVFEKG